MTRFHSSGRRLLLAVGALVLTVPIRDTAAQGPGVFDAFAARKESPSDPLFTGLALTGYSGVFGIRVSGALNFNNGNSTPQTQAYGTYYRCDPFGGCRTYRTGTRYTYDSGLGIGVGGWSADADLMFAPFRALPVVKSLLLGFSPYAFVGIGGEGINPSNAADTSRAVWSFGVGVHHDLLGWLGLSAEARNRRSFQSDSVLAIGSRRNWEYRAGLSISFAGHRDAVPSRPPNGIIMPIEHPEVDRFETAESAARITARVLDRAEGLVDTPFRSGSTNPSIGFDAAGFVQYVYGEEGVGLPRTSHAIAEMGEEVSTRVGSLRPGDLLFFGNDGVSIDHVAIYAGHHRIVHATASGDGVRYDVLGEGPRGEWFADHLVTARRIVAEGRARPHVRQDDSRDQGALDTPDRAPRTDRARGA
jgi:cell wall-associated NlpC family hydrolase